MQPFIFFLHLDKIHQLIHTLFKTTKIVFFYYLLEFLYDFDIKRSFLFFIKN